MGPHTIYCHVAESDWAVHFMDTDEKTRIGPWLLCENHAEVVKILRWGHMTDDELDQHHINMRRWGVGGGKLHLSSRERHQLIDRGRGWTWTGYELLKMKKAGTYPPQRLTDAQSEAFARSRKRA
jgi:hypothetical protein